MKVILIGRPEAAINGGGDKVQILKTQEYLKRIGIAADVSFNPSVSLSGYDLAHLFTLDTWDAYKQVKKRNLPYAISPIFWDSREMIYEQRKNASRIRKIYYEYERRMLIKSAADILLSLKKFVALTLESPSHIRNAYIAARNYPKYRLSDANEMRKEIVANACIALPNAEMEMRCLEGCLGIKKRYRVIPNAADKLFAKATRQKYGNPMNGMNDYVLCVAAVFSFRKNQINLLRATRDLDINVVLVGNARSATEKKYLNECQRIGNKKVSFLPQLNQADLMNLYAWAKVHVLPSWYETPGLVSLEAALSGCSIVTTNRGTAKEYLGDLAWYCSPNSVESIRAAVLNAYEGGSEPTLKRKILGAYVWEITAEETKKAYELIC